MARNIVICSDGTGNEYGRANSNVVKLFETLDLSDKSRQIAFYDPGLGTAPRPGAMTYVRKKLSIAAGLAFGAGITANISDAYAYLMDEYQPGDRVFLFGFSRGAYTVRALSGLLHMCGLLQKGSKNLIPYAIKLHRQRSPDFEVAEGFKKTFSRECKLHFVGVWDTVKSVGLWDNLKSLDIFKLRTALPYTYQMPDMKYGRHAISIDERRKHFRTNRWQPENGDAYQQVWFAGVHSDVGGGYVETGLSDLALRWMLEGAVGRDLLVQEGSVEAIQGNPLADAHESLTPAWYIAGWKPRTIPDGAWIHNSVQQRAQGRPDYKPSVPTDAVFVE